MARTDTLQHFLTDVADSIREKKGTEGLIQASNFDTEIESIPTGGGADLSEYFNTYYEGDFPSKIVKKMPLITVSSNVQYIESLFEGMAGLESVDIIFENSSNLSGFDYVFSGCLSLKSVNLRDFDASNLTSANYAFAWSGLEELDLSSWNVSSLGNMMGMFNECYELRSLNLSTWNPQGENVLTSGMFWGCESLEFLDISRFDLTNFSETIGMFGNLEQEEGRVPADCLIVVKGSNEKNWVRENFNWLTNVQTYNEYHNIQN